MYCYFKNVLLKLFCHYSESNGIKYLQFWVIIVERYRHRYTLPDFYTLYLDGFWFLIVTDHHPWVTYSAFCVPVTPCVYSNIGSVNPKKNPTYHSVMNLNVWYLWFCAVVVKKNCIYECVLCRWIQISYYLIFYCERHKG